MDKIKEILRTLKPAKGIQLATGVSNVLDGKNSSWYYKMNFNNTSPHESVHVVLLNAGISSNRVQRWFDISGEAYYKDLEGLDNKLTGIPNDDYIIVKDDPTEINHAIKLSADLVATNFKLRGLNPQLSLLNSEIDGNSFLFDSTSNNATIDQFRKALINNTLKHRETQISSDNEQQFSQNIFYGQFNGIEKPIINRIDIAQYFKAESNRKKIEILKTIYFDTNTFYSIEIPANTTTSLTWIFESLFSSAKYLEQKNEYEQTLKNIV